MTKLLIAEEMRSIEAQAIAAGQVTGAELMERAGAGVVAVLHEVWPELTAGAPVAVLCGPGNNGGDGFVIARHLAAQGAEVAVFFFGAADGLSAEARTNHDLWAAMAPVTVLERGNEADAAIAGAGLIVDALFGIGLTRGLPLALQHVALQVETARAAGARVVAVDLPSGLCADSGRELGGIIPADLTVTFHAAKLGHHLADGPKHCGMLRVVDLGLPQDVGRAELVGPPSNLAKGSGHKYQHGHVFVLSGGIGHGGATRLAARAALRVGAGLVTLGVPPAAMTENAARLDAVMLAAMRSPTGIGLFFEDARINAFCVGPGLAEGLTESEFVKEVLKARKPSVLDAGALTLLSQYSELQSLVHQDCVLTPHDGEFARLFPPYAEQLAARPANGPAFSRVNAARAAARAAQCIVLLKGPDTIIADWTGRTAIHSANYGRTAPWLATAGAGDVLGGMIAGLMARGFPAFEAACTGAWLHVECARTFGPGLIAEDLAEQLPAVFRAMGL